MDLTDFRPHLSSEIDTDSDTDVGLLSAGGVVALTQTLKMLHTGKKKKEQNQPLNPVLTSSWGVCTNCNIINSQSVSPSGSAHNTSKKPGIAPQTPPLESKSPLKYQESSKNIEDLPYDEPSSHLKAGTQLFDEWVNSS